MQLVGGHLADKYSLKPIYVLGFLTQVPLLWALSLVSGLPLLATIIIMMMCLYAVLPAENLMLAHYSPETRHGLVFGLKFVLAFGAAPISVQLVSWIVGADQTVTGLFGFLALLAAAITTVAMFLPHTRLGALR